MIIYWIDRIQLDNLSLTICSLLWRRVAHATITTPPPPPLPRIMSAELITSRDASNQHWLNVLSKHFDTLTKCWVYCGPMSETADQHSPSIGAMYRLAVCYNGLCERSEADIALCIDCLLGCVCQKRFQ